MVEIAKGYYKGKTLFDIINLNHMEMIGELLPCNGEVPIIVKLIATNQNLSVQVHPSSDDNLPGCSIDGKSEMWYIVDCKPGSYIYCGFNKKTSAHEV